MNIEIGKIIKRLRTQKDITQEELASAFNISSAAVSKWERGDTLPDIPLLPQLAFYFHVSIDELMGYSESRTEKEITDIIEKHTRLAEEYKIAAGKELSAEAYKKYPNDYRVMELYMWDLVGGYADNDSARILTHQATLNAICDRILSGCTDTYIRNDAIVMRGKILHANGQTIEALSLYKDKLPSWFQTCGQKSEQLFAKDTREFASLLRSNLFELIDLALNKKSKEIWFCNSDSISEKTACVVGLCEALKELKPYIPENDLQLLISHFASDFESKLHLANADSALSESIHRFI